ncbi:hypothetical protein LTS09_017062 [Friedmanniomyces endolithicus]|nr:hypothetical protein LTS09_017062 [Friedmanniomyces endolithicus]
MSRHNVFAVFGIALRDLGLRSKSHSSKPGEHDEADAALHGQTHGRATLPRTRAHLLSGERLARFRVRASRSRIFLALTLLNAVMFTINVVQIFLLERIVDSVFWVAGFPAIVFASMLLALLLWALPFHATLSETWRDASRSTRSAWIGNCLSILLPIILCEFVYMNQVAVPAFKTKTWSTSVLANNILRVPSFAISQYDLSVQVTFGACMIYGTPDNPTGDDCTPNIQTNASSGVSLTFNASTPAVVLSQTSGISILYNVSYNSSQEGYQGATWELVVYDSHQDTVLMQDCDPSVPLELSVAVSQHAIYLRQTTIADDVGAIAEDSQDCSADIYTHYNQYETSVQTLPMVTGQGDQCDLGLPNYTGPCLAFVTMSYSSFLVTTLKSSHGTDWKQMLLDEGSIVGGTMFVTWFFNIFIVT